MNKTLLTSTIRAILTSGKGILAADESFPTIEKRFAALDIPSTEENRRAYRELLFTTPNLNESISGVILFDETIRQKIGDNSMVEALAQKTIVPGIKVDKGTIALVNCPGEKITQGLDGLRERLAEYRELGALFTKWRAVITIDKSIPTHCCIEENADTLALFAALSQEAGLVPIIEPEVLMEGNHTLARCEEVTCTTLSCVFGALFEHQVAMEHVLLKTGMVLSGSKCAEQATIAEVAEATIRCLRRTVPAAVPGIIFLSGGQSDVAATERLNAICATGVVPWTLSFSFGRALQDAALKTWKGSATNVARAQAALHLRAKCNSLALHGKYSAESENAPRLKSQKDTSSVPRNPEPNKKHQTVLL
jgi:fructose-bisphosphate aldolase class I